MPAGGYLTDLLLLAWVAGTLALFALVARRGGRRAVAVPCALAAVVAAAALAGELCLRYVATAPDEAVPSLATRSWTAAHWTPEQNADGFRDAAWGDARAPGVVRILLVGDEVVAGWGVDARAERVGDRLAVALGSGFEVRSAGRPTWGIGDEAEWLARALPAVHAQRVVLLAALDDAAGLLAPQEQPDVGALLAARSRVWNTERWFTLDALWVRGIRDELDAWSALQVHALARPDVAARHAALAARVAATCRGAGVELDVALLPWLGAETRELADARRNALDAWRAAGAARVLDLADVYDADARIGARAPWPDASGHARLAERLQRELFAPR